MFNQVYQTPILDIYNNKKICLLGCGSSLDSHTIDFASYDVVVGLNRIYCTHYFKYLNIFYNCLSYQDWQNLEHMIKIITENNNIKQTIFIPWRLPRHKKIFLNSLCNKYILNYIYTNTIPKNAYFSGINRVPLTGVSVLNHISMCSPQSIDIYGFDFYTKKYIDNIIHYKNYSPNRHHDIESNKAFFFKLLSKNSNIKWHQ